MPIGAVGKRHKWSGSQRIQEDPNGKRWGGGSVEVMRLKVRGRNGFIREKELVFASSLDAIANLRQCEANNI
jgi:hypothetical protein